MLWIVDLNRQSLDRVVPGIRAAATGSAVRGERLAGGRGEVRPAAAGGLRATRRRGAAPAHRRHGQRGVSGAHPPARSHTARADRLLERGHLRDGVALASPTPPTTTLPGLLADLGGHDLQELLDAFAAADADTEPPDRPLRLHDQGLGAADRRRCAQPLGAADAPSKWTRCAKAWAIAPERRVGRLRARLAARGSSAPSARADAARRGAAAAATAPEQVPARLDVRPGRADLHAGGVRLDAGQLARVPGVGERIVTTSPDVAVSTNLGAWINRVGVFAPEDAARLHRRRRRACCAGSRGRAGGTSSSASRR